MDVKEQLTEPWGIVTAALLGGLGGAVTAALAPVALLGVPVGLGIAGAVYGVKVALGILSEHVAGPVRPRDSADAALPVAPRGSKADGWLRRAEAAVQTLHRQTETPADPTLRAQISDVDDQAAGALTDLRRFAGQVTLIEQAVVRIDAPRLEQERTALKRGLGGLPAGALREERERALHAVDDQLEVAHRLDEARETLLARMQSAVLGLEGLVARMAELLALHSTIGGGSLTETRVAELTSDLEGMRAGLAEAEQVSRSTLAGGPADPVPPVPPAASA